MTIELLARIELLEQENEKLNHYKLLYQKVKDRNDKAIEILESNNEEILWQKNLKLELKEFQ